jgi:2-polyprenyl-3-methyl-5-hydroxy-6-metoxy-1,4-benzoquinol methylase
MFASVTSQPFITGLRVAFVDPTLWEELDLCPVCRRAEYLRDIGTVEGKALGTVASVCLDCEHGFLRRRPVKEWYDRFYSQEWDQEGHAWAEKRQGGTRSGPDPYPLKFCADHLPAHSNVLDVGAGFGEILLPFQKHGHNVHGIERSMHRAKYLRDVLGIPCFHASIESFKPSDKFGLICINHVLEHVSDPFEVIGILAAMLPEGGMVYIAVPDLWRAEYPPQAFHFIPHLSWFSTKSLHRLLIGSGLQILKTEEKKEIQVLAVKRTARNGDRSETGDADSRSAFWEKISTSVIQAFGARIGRHNLVWFIDDNHERWFYQRQVFSGPRGISKLIEKSIAIEGALPERVRSRLHRFVPEFVTNGKTRILTVDLKGDVSLPVTVKYPHQQAPVWVK